MPHTAAPRQIVRAYMSAHASYVTPLSVTQLCHRSAVSRTTFYKHFEGIEDLEEQFLNLYFDTMMGAEQPPIINRLQLQQFYQRLVHAMRSQREFFFRIFFQKDGSDYRLRWLALVEERASSLFRRPGIVTIQRVWDLHLDLGLGVVHRYLALALTADECNLDELTNWMMEYLWGGLIRFKDLIEGTSSPMERPLNQALERRARRRES